VTFAAAHDPTQSANEILVRYCEARAVVIEACRCQGRQLTPGEFAATVDDKLVDKKVSRILLTLMALRLSRVTKAPLTPASRAQATTRHTGARSTRTSVRAPKPRRTHRSASS
jgi:hypothetical protein